MINIANYEILKSFSHSLGVEQPEGLLFFPKFIQIETVAVCNAHCIMCPVKSLNREVHIMKNDIFEKIKDELSVFSHWIRRVTIQLGGEPLLDNNLENRISILKKIGIKEVFFSCNASLMDEARAKSILSSGVDQVDFSFDGATSETFEAIRKGLNFDKCLKNIINFIRIRNELKANTRVRIRVTIQERNRDEMREIVSLWQNHLARQDSIYGKLLHNFMNWMTDYSLPIEQQQEKLNSKPCTSLWSSFVILSDGRVSLCCSDLQPNVLLGRISDSSIQNIWRSEIMRKIRDGHLSKGRRSFALCKDCNVWDESSRIELSKNDYC